MSSSQSGDREPVDQYYQGKSLEGIRDDVLDANFPERLARIEQAEAVARRFHEEYERLAPGFGYETREASRVPWEQVPEHNRNLMVATVAALIERGDIAVPERSA